MMADRVGQQLGNYRLVRLLGQGGFADVYLGEHLRLGTQAAIKVLSARLSSQEAIVRFEQEARTIAHLRHPHIVRILDYDVEGEMPFLVMDYAPGGTLRQRHPKGTPLSINTVIPYVSQIADALQYAHNQHVIHRDVKSENMLIGEQGEVLLSDFGIAIVAQSSRYQNTQEMGGTMGYIAPEQIQGHPRPASDQYSLGIVVYEWLTGDCPFHGSMTEIIAQHLAVSPPSLRTTVPTISPYVEQVVLKALEKDAKERFERVHAFAIALEQAEQATFPASQHQASTKRLSPASQPPTTTVPSTYAHSPSQQSHPPTMAAKAGQTPPGSSSSLTQPPTPSQERAPSARHFPHRAAIVAGLVALLIVALTSRAVWFTAHQASPARGILASPTGSITGFSTHQASPAGSITEFPLPPGSNPGGIAAGPDGNLWFTDYGTNKIGRISPDGTITGFYLPTGKIPPAWNVITAGPDGNLWFTEGNAGKIGRISPSGTITDFSLPTANSYALGIVAGPDGNLWFTEADADKIGRISLSGTITEFPLPPGSNPEGIAAGSDGNLWVTDYGTNKIGRISLSGAITEFPVPTIGSTLSGITAGPDGNLWFTEDTGNKIGRISPSGAITEFPVPTAKGYLITITAGSDGNLWFTESNSNKIGRISPSGAISEFPLPPGSIGPYGIITGSDSNLWFTESNKIGRITSGK
jgi:streptogramin lyase